MSHRTGTKFKETEIGPIPEEWDVLPLSDFADLIKDSYIPSVLENIPYIGLEHIDQQTLSLNSVGISSDTKSIKFQFKEDDVLFGKLRPYFRKVYRSGLSGVCSTDIWVIRKKENSDSRFLFYLLASDEFIQSANISSGGTRMPRADWGHLKKTCWPFPPLDEQKRIAEVLSSLDEKIELNRKMNKTLEEIAQALFKRWFVDFEFPADSTSRNQAGEPIEPGKPYKSSGGKMIDSDLGLIPEGWRVENLSDVIGFEGGSQPPKSEHIYEWKDGYVRFVQNRDYSGKSHITFIAESQRNKLCDSYDIMMDKYGDVGTPRFGLEGAYNVALAKIVPKVESSREYLRRYFSQQSVVGSLAASAQASTRGSLNAGTFSGMRIMVPDKKVLWLFENIGREHIRMQLHNDREGELIVSLRDALLPRLMSGRIRTNS